MDKFCTEYLRRSILQVLTSAGFEKSSRIAGEVFADVLKEYLMCLGKSTQESAINAGRTKATSTDVLAAFEELEINIDELKEWAQTEGKNLGGYAGPQPVILKDLLRDGLPGYSVNNVSNRLPNIVNQNAKIVATSSNEIQAICSAEGVSTLENKHQPLNLAEGIQNFEFHEDVVIKKREDKMIIDTDDSNGNAKNLTEDKVNEKLEEEINNESKFSADGNENRFDDTTEMQIDISVDQPNNYVKSLEQWPQVRPSYVPEWLPPFPTIISHKEDREKGDEHEAKDKKPEPAVDNAESAIVENITGINSEMKGASTSSLVNTPHDRNVKTSRRIKRSPDQRPPTYDQFTNIYKSITSTKQTMKDLEAETTKDEKKKKRKLKVSTLSLFPSHHAFETKFDGCDGIIPPETPNSLPFFKDIPRKIPIFAYPPPKPSKSVESKAPSQTVSASSDAKIVEEKLSASRKGKEKEKMIIFTPDNFEAPMPQPLPSKSQTPVQRDTKSKSKKAYTPVSSEKPIQKPRKGSQAGTTVLKLRVGTSAASTISSTPSVQTELVVNNDTADPPEIINCICPYPLSEIDDGNFMLSCDNCQVWFHGICTGFGPTPVEVNTWYCERCIEKGIS